MVEPKRRLILGGPGKLGVSDGFLLVLAWAVFIVAAKRQGSPPWWVLTLAATTGLIWTVTVVARARGDAVMRDMWIALLIGFQVLILEFALLYWSAGSRQNFNMPLTHLDALYLAVGTLSTAGTGNLVAISETGRAIQTVQMIVDMGFVLLAVTAVVTRYMATHD